MKKLNCENYLCVYQSKGKCIFDEIDLDITGQCLACVYPDIDDKFLNEIKKKAIKKLDSYL